MGVQGLFTFVLNKAGNILPNHKFSDCQLIIDGTNLLFMLYMDSGLDQNQGGEYAEFEQLLEKFVAALRNCNIKPYVLMDGGADPLDRKRDKRIEKATASIRNATAAAQSGESKGILPPLARSVFIQTMARLQVPLAQCYGEADKEIAALAKEWECPVLSNDSDFFIFQLPSGVLPTKLFRWKDATTFVPCKIYRASSFCTHIELPPEMLPVFAVLAGNDFVNIRQFNRSQFGGGRLEGLLSWLQQSRFPQPEAALDEALRLLGNQDEESRQQLRSQLIMAMEDYQIPASVIKEFFDRGVAPPLPDNLVDWVPDWMRLPLTKAQLTSEVLDVLLLQRIDIRPTVEMSNLPSANLTSRPLRQLMYWLLLGGEGPEVTEMDREGLELMFNPVNPVNTDTTQRLPLAELRQADAAVRLQVLLRALGVTEASLSRFLPELHLPVAVTFFWLHNALLPPDRLQLEALLQGMVGLEEGVAELIGAVEALLSPEPPQHPTYAFNQWQLCLRDAMYLNQLLDFPLPDPTVARLFQGTGVHHHYNSMLAPIHSDWRKQLQKKKQWRQAPPHQSK
ncbi:unnamed protein product [Ophioblennius macclurei]